jgi:DNA-binding GntR family transcriptional regulator
LITAVYRSRHLHNCGPDEHKAIVDDIARRDVVAAVKAVTEHLDRVEHELELEDEKDQSYNLRAALF